MSEREPERSSGGPTPGPNRVRVKICGVTSPSDARIAVDAGADLIGLNFYARSPRAIDAERAASIVAVLPRRVWRVGVFVNASRAEIARLAYGLGLSAIQLHGDEPPELMLGWPMKVVRAVRLTAPLQSPLELGVTPDYVLCEGAAAHDPTVLDQALGQRFGGTGARFDWEWARPVPRERLFLAGGLVPENVADAVRALRPFAVDVASGVERSPGVKDPAKLAAFIEHAKTA